MSKGKILEPLSLNPDRGLNIIQEEDLETDRSEGIYQKNQPKLAKTNILDQCD
jgi:hypothetical protein